MNLQKYTIIVLILTCMLLNSCLPVEKIELERIRSPDNLVDAVFVRTNSGAMSSYNYILYIVPAGKDYKDDFFVMGITHLRGYEINWENQNMIVFEYNEGDILRQRNVICMDKSQQCYKARFCRRESILKDDESRLKNRD